MIRPPVSPSSKTVAHKPEHVVDLDSSAIVAVKIHHADKDYHSRNALMDKVGTPKGWADLPATLLLVISENKIFVIVLVEAENPLFFVTCIDW